MDHTESADSINDSALELPAPLGLTSTSNRDRASSLRYRRPSIRIQRLPSNVAAPSQDDTTQNLKSTPPTDAGNTLRGGRGRSSSEPQPGRWSAPTTKVVSQDATGSSAMPMPCVYEETSSPTQVPSSESPQIPGLPAAPPPTTKPPGRRNMLRRTSEVVLSAVGRNRAATISGSSPLAAQQTNEYDPRLVDVLDVVDPEVSALTTLTNVQNSLFVPNLGPIINRRPTFTLTRVSSSEVETTSTEESGEQPAADEQAESERLRRFTTVTSALQDPRYAVLPDGTDVEGWSEECIEELNDHVRHMLHSRRSKFKRGMKGFGLYVRKPLGFLVTLYATLITLFGLAWVLFLIGWINIGGRQLYIINVIDNVLVALFAVMGDGLAPFRAVDTYHMVFVAHYTHLTWKTRRKKGIPHLKDRNDLPSRRQSDVNVEHGLTGEEDGYEFSVLNPRQQRRLVHHQEKLSRSHTFYNPHETATHHAFRLHMLIAILVLLDCHSLLQIALGTCTWAISYHVRPFALTTVILCCSIACNITAGILILIGDRGTRKKDVVERLFRQQLTEKAMKEMQKKMQKKRRKQEKREREKTYVAVAEGYEKEPNHEHGG